MRRLSVIHPDWWDYTTLDPHLLQDAARLTPEDLCGLSRDGFRVVIHDTVPEFYLAEALEYIEAWRQATPAKPAGICGPIGPTEQLPLVAQLVNALELDLRHAHFWGMDEWVVNGKEVSTDFWLSFEAADRQLCFDRIRNDLRMPESHLHFPKVASIDAYSASFDQFRCVVMQGGQGDVKHWAFNDPPRREGPYRDRPPAPEEYRRLGTRVVDLHPLTNLQNARTSAGGMMEGVPTQAITVGPRETWKAERVSIWQAGQHDSPLGMRLTTLMISQRLADSAVPMSLLSDHPNVEFHFLRSGLGSCEAEMH